MQASWRAATGRASGRVVGAVLAGCAAWLAACGGTATDEAPGPNVLLVTVDTLRADALGCLGGEVGCTPRIDALAGEGLVFSDAQSHAPWTLPSFASLFTSQPPSRHGAGGRVPQFRGLPEEAETLAEVFAAAGYDTAAVTNVTFLSETFGTTQGFEHVDGEAFASNRRVRRADATTDAALEWLGTKRRRPFLLLVHYFDPHAVYDPPTTQRLAHAAETDRFTDWTFGTREDVVNARTGNRPPTADVLQRARALYEGEIAFVDQEVGRLLDGVARIVGDEPTIVVLTADHGEEFGDHGDWEHGHSLYGELMRVPLILSWPGTIRAGLREEPVGLIDVAPTLCALAGVGRPASFSGRDLLLPRSAQEPRALYAQGNFWGEPLESWREGSWKLVRFPDGSVELYDLERDPLEREDLAAERPELVEELGGRLEAARALHAGGDGAEVQLSPEQRERLGELGYLGGEEDE